MDTQKIALVTGGIGGIGTAICVALADQGRKVIAGYFPPEAEIASAWQAKHRDNGYEFEIVACDVSDFESSKQMLHDVENTIGSVDILVNCAGITRDKTLRRMTHEQWDAVLRTNLDSAFNVTRQVVEGMTEKGFGRIVNISSVNGQKGQFGQANYSAAKAGLHGFTMAIAQETALKGVTVNTVSPGYVATEMTKAIAPDILESITQTIPMRRMGEPEEIAQAVAWLADEATAYVTGANIPVNGGLFMAA